MYDTTPPEVQNEYKGTIIMGKADPIGGRQGRNSTKEWNKKPQPRNRNVGGRRGRTRIATPRPATTRQDKTHAWCMASSSVYLHRMLCMYEPKEKERRKERGERERNASLSRAAAEGNGANPPPRTRTHAPGPSGSPTLSKPASKRKRKCTARKLERKNLRMHTAGIDTHKHVPTWLPACLAAAERRKGGRKEGRRKYPNQSKKAATTQQRVHKKEERRWQLRKGRRRKMEEHEARDVRVREPGDEVWECDPPLSWLAWSLPVLVFVLLDEEFAADEDEEDDNTAAMD
ncbi:hypothetical protein C8R45DRAFT_938029 [Mycena sanguinolenta]|nr:hypothetical protein C8R45DRAFT_938029 [Mycena sanguinolenta]